MITQKNARNDVIASAGQTVLNFSFELFVAAGVSQIRVFKKIDDARVITIEPSQYGVDLINKTITFNVAFTQETLIVIARYLPPEQNFSFALAGLVASKAELALDYEMMISQQIDEHIEDLISGFDSKGLNLLVVKNEAVAARDEAVEAAQASEDAAAESGTYADSAAAASSAAATSAANAASSETAAQEAAQQAWQQAINALAASKYEISGVIMSGGGNPVENQEVILKSNGLTYTVYTAADGSYIIKNLPKGIDIVISAPNSNEGIIHIANPQDNIIQNFTVPQKIALKDLPVGFDFSGKTIYLPADFVPSVFSWQPNSLEASISINYDGQSGYYGWSIGRTYSNQDRWGIKSGATSELLVMATINPSEQTITILATQFTFDNEHEYILANNYAGQDDATLSREFLAAAYVLE